MKRIVFGSVMFMMLASGLLFAQEGIPQGPVYVSEPVAPTLSPPARLLPDPEKGRKLFFQEMKRREDYGFIPFEYPIQPVVDPLLAFQQNRPSPQPDAFSVPLKNFAGQTSPSSPPDDTGDVGRTYYIQGINGFGSYSNSAVTVYNKSTGASVKTFSLESLASGSPCNSGYCDPIVLFDRMADRWLIAEFPSSGGHLCVYVSQTNDPTGSWYAYAYMNVETSTPDYPKYGIWPQNGNGGAYFVGINAGASGKHDVVALDRAKMLAGLPGTYQKFQVNDLPNSGFQLVLPANHQGSVAPPDGSPAIVMRPRDDEAQDGASTPAYDLLEMWAINVDWATPANSTITQLTSVHMGDYDMTLCGMGGTWNCMPQAGTTQKIDPIREPVHFPLQYRRFNDHETLLGCFVEDVDGTDHAAMRWFEMRKTTGAWTLFQEGVVGGEANVHRSVASISMDQSGNIAMGYTRTGTTLYPSIYYAGRLATDPLNTMPQGEYVIQDATTSKTDNERWGDYAGMGVDPVDDCTFWFTTEYGGSGATRIAAMKFDACGCLSTPAAPTASASAPQPNRITISWDDSATTTITEYWLYRATVAGGPYAQIATVPDSSLGVGGGAGYSYNDDTVSGGTRYYYVVKSHDGAACTSAASTEVNALATGACTLPPTFAGLASVTNTADPTCTLGLTWSAATPACAGPVTYSVYRSTTPGFTPSAANRIVQDLTGTSYADLEALVYGTTYYYVVRAIDTSNSVEDTNTVEMSGAATGPYSDGTWAAGAEAGDPSMTLGTPWVTSTTYKRTGTSSYRTGNSYPTSACGALETPSLVLGTGAVLTYYHIYSTEAGYDGGRVEISTNGGGAWSVLTPTPAYAGTITSSGNACSWPTTTACYIGTSTGYPTTWQLATVDLSAYNGLPALIRWRFTTDSSGAGTGANPGWYVDDIQVTHAQVPSACSTGSSCANSPTAVDVVPDGPLAVCEGTGSLLTANVTGGVGPFTYQWFDGGSAISGATDPTFTANATGAHSYNCRVTGSGCSTGRFDAVPTAITWQAGPTFAGLASVTNPNSSTCTLDLAWSAAATPCPGGVTYNVYRSTTTPVSTVAGNLVASGLTTTSYSDTASLVSGMTYYYLVRAANVSNGIEDANTVEKSGAPSGTLTIQTLTDTFEGAASGGGFDLAGWSHTAITGTTNWAWSTAQKYDGTHSWFAQDIATVSDMALISPPFGVVASTTLSFYHTYKFEGTSTCFDGGTLEVTTNGGSTWTVVPDADFSAGVFNGTVSTSFSNPIGGKRAWCFGTVGAMTQVVANLGSDASLLGKTVQVRWHEGNDSSTVSTGWYVDHVVLTDVGSAGSCTTAVIEHLLTVTTTGNGTVTSTPAGISCGATCSALFTHGTVVDLSPTPDPGWTFTGWGGACSGVGACQVTMDAAKSVAATFSINPHLLTVSRIGNGMVTSAPAGITCGATCSASFSDGILVDLTAAADPGWTFTGWGGACSGSTTCQVTIDADKSVSATFTLNTYLLSVSRTGNGTVTSNPVGISCGATCSSSFNYGTVVDLTAAPDLGWTFTGWGGACSGNAACQVTVNDVTSVSATFTINSYLLTVSRTGNGTVTSTPAGVSCGATCSSSFTYGSVVDLGASPDPGWTFTGWGGACSGNTTCQVTVNNATSVSATFRLPLAANALAVDPVSFTTGTGNHNGVFEPGESVPVVPTWRNNGAASSISTGALSLFSGLSGATYTIVDLAADYGTVAIGSSADCTGSGDCYQLEATQTAGRPATHWDTTVVETLSTGETKSWTLHLGASFTDMPVSATVGSFYHYVETLLHSGTTAGCTTTTYCPTNQVNRAQMAMFVARVMNGGVDTAVPVSGTVPSKGTYNCILGGSSVFPDVAPEAQYCRHVHYIASQGVTLGCTATTYCPTSIVPRSQMAMFISRAIAGGDAGVPTAYTDPISSNTYDCSTTTPNTHFTDVTSSVSYCKHVHYLWAKSIIAGCVAVPAQYCPASNVRRDQMAKFLVNGFGLTLYHP